METTEANGKLNEQKGKLKQKFANLTDNTLLFAEGQRDEISGKRQINFAKTKEELRKIVSTL